MGELGETPNSLKGEKIIKDKAIERHYGVVKTPGISDEERRRALDALRILSRDIGKPIIVKLIDSLERDKGKNKNV